MPAIKFEGLEDLTKAMAKKASMEDVKRVVAHNTHELFAGAVAHAEFRGHYEGKNFITPTGNLKRSIGEDIKDAGLTGEVEPTVPYAGYVENGTRFMAAQPYLKPAFDVQKAKFKADMNKLVK